MWWPNGDIRSGGNVFSRLEKRLENPRQLRSKDHLVDKLVLRFPEFVSVGPRVPRVLDPSLLDDHESRLLDFLEIVKSGAVSVEVGVTRHRLLWIEVAITVEEDESVERSNPPAFETR